MQPSAEMSNQISLVKHNEDGEARSAKRSSLTLAVAAAVGTSHVRAMCPMNMRTYMLIHSLVLCWDADLIRRRVFSLIAAALTSLISAGEPQDETPQLWKCGH